MLRVSLLHTEDDSNSMYVPYVYACAGTSK
jgi:hypothetical protein